MTRVRRLLALWIGLLAGALLLGLIVEGNSFDGATVRSVAADRSPGATSVARAITQLGGVWLDILFAAAVVGLLLAGRRRDALLVLLATGGSMLLTNLVKVVLERPRPAGGGLVSVASASWPSGHASSSIAFYGALASLAAAGASPAGRRAVWAGCAVLVALVGASRVYLGVHYPTDVVAGWVLGGLWLACVLRLVSRPPPDALGAAAGSEADRRNPQSP